MRCYFIRNGHIAWVEIMADDLAYEVAIDQAHELFEQHQERKFDGFELWHLSLRLWSWPPNI